MTTGLPIARSAGQATSWVGGGLQVRVKLVGKDEWHGSDTTSMQLPSVVFTMVHCASSVNGNRVAGSALGAALGLGFAMGTAAGRSPLTTGGAAAGAEPTCAESFGACVTAVGVAAGTKAPLLSAHPAKLAAAAAKVATSGREKFGRKLLADISSPSRKRRANATAGWETGGIRASGLQHSNSQRVSAVEHPSGAPTLQYLHMYAQAPHRSAIPR
jgi:hypothetical protein